MPLNFLIKTFGCKTNQYESQGVRELLTGQGMVEVKDASKADLCIVNTCAVTVRADASCRNAVRSVFRSNPKIKLFITGCAIDLRQEWPEKLPGVVEVFPNPEKHAVLGFISRHFPQVSAPPDAPGNDRFGLSISKFSGHTRAFLKIQDGCENYCTYCTIPFARGKSESRGFASVITEAENLIANGYRELVLTGINIGQYHNDNKQLADLVAGISTLPGLYRLRLGSVEPQCVSDRLLESIRDCETVCNHLHIPLQNGDDSILRKMNRKYDTAGFREVVRRVREVLHNPAITTDIIVGFPGEGENEFANTLALCDELGFSRMHVFLFSARPGTPAAKLKQTSANHDITRRRDRLIELGEETAAKYAGSFIGETVSVIIETTGKNFSEGYTDRYLRCRIDTSLKKGERFEVTVTGFERDGLVARIS